MGNTIKKGIERYEMNGDEYIKITDKSNGALYSATFCIEADGTLCLTCLADGVGERVAPSEYLEAHADLQAIAEEVLA